MLKIVEMHINPGPVQNINKAQMWLDKVSVFLPNNQNVYKLTVGINTDLLLNV